MADTKHAQIRYLTFDKCFSHPYRKYCPEDLPEACRIALEAISAGTKLIARRQLFNDISYVRSEAGFGWPVVSFKVERKCITVISEPFQPNQPLNQANYILYRS